MSWNELSGYEGKYGSNNECKYKNYKPAEWLTDWLAGLVVCSHRVISKMIILSLGFNVWSLFILKLFIIFIPPQLFFFRIFFICGKMFCLDFLVCILFAILFLFRIFFFFFHNLSGLCLIRNSNIYKYKYVGVGN